MSIRLREILILVFALIFGATTFAGVVSNYRVNGETVHEGATFAEFREVAGDPLAVEPVNDNDRYVEWVYQCVGTGAGPCKVVAQGGKREMRARFALGRLKLIRFERL